MIDASVHYGICKSLIDAKDNGECSAEEIQPLLELSLDELAAHL